MFSYEKGLEQARAVRALHPGVNRYWELRPGATVPRYLTPDEMKIIRGDFVDGEEDSDDKAEPADGAGLTDSGKHGSLTAGGGGDAPGGENVSGGGEHSDHQGVEGCLA